jgi:DNA primase
LSPPFIGGTTNSRTGIFPWQGNFRRKEWVSEMIDLLDLIGKDVTLMRKATTNEGEYAGPCPFCGGTDRFLVWPYAEKPGFWCRQCDRKGDAIDYVRLMHNMGYREAVEALGGRLEPVARPRPLVKPVDSAWQEKAQAVVADCQEALWSSEKALAWLEKERGLTEDTLRAWGVGYCPKDGEYHGLYVHRGIVLPWIVGERIWKVQIRRPDSQKRYMQIAGAPGDGIYGKLTGNSDCVIVEGEFDAMLLWQELSDNYRGGLSADVLTLGSASGRLADRWLPCLVKTKRFWIATDNDEAGHKAAAYWLDLVGKRGRRILPPGDAKDVGEAWKAGNDLAAWMMQVWCGGSEGLREGRQPALELEAGRV